MSRERSAEGFHQTKPSLSAVLVAQKGNKEVITITQVDEPDFDGQKKLAIQSEEYPDNTWFPSGPSINMLFAKLGSDLDRWVGKQVPLVRVTNVYNPSTKTRGDVFRAAQGDQWDKQVKEYRARK